MIKTIFVFCVLFVLANSLSLNCTKEDTEIGLTWCHYNNPYVVSNFLSRNSTDLTKSTSNGETFTINMKCSETSKNSHECQAIQQIRTATVGRLLPDGRNSENMARFVIFTDLDGQMLFVHFNNNTMASRYNVGIQHVKHFDVIPIRDRISGEAAGSPFQNVVMMAANETSLGLKALHGKNYEFTKTCFLFTNLTVTTALGMSLSTATFFPKDNNFTNLVNLGWIWERALWANASNGTMIDVRGYAIYVAPANQSQVMEYIETCPTSLPLNQQRAVFIYAPKTTKVKFEFFHNVQSNLTFLFAYTEDAVMVYGLTNGGTINKEEEEATGEILYESTVWVMAQWCHNKTVYNASTNKWENLVRQQTVIYCVPDKQTRITTLSVFSTETMTNIWRWTHDIWVAVGLQNQTNTWIHAFDLQELVYLPRQESTLLNPLGLPDNFGYPSFPCDFETQIYNNGKCYRRYHVDFPFDHVSAPITQIAVRPIEEAKEKNVSVNATSLNIDEQIPIVEERHMVFFVSQARTVSVVNFYGSNHEPAEGGPPPVFASLANEVVFLGDVKYMYPSTNAQHLFTAISRDKWEIDSQERYLEICKKLDEDPSDPFLSHYASSCEQWPPQEVNLNTFAQYTSYCSFNLYCPSLDEPSFEFPRSRYYADRPAVLKLCPKGSFCSFGQKTLCPFGFYCDEEGMSAPKRCPSSSLFNLTCAKPGLIEPETCPEGTVCFVPHIPGTPAPPGRMVPRPPIPRNDFDNCNDHQWCGLGAQQFFNESKLPEDAFTCPTNTFCVNSSVLEPTICRCVNGTISNGQGDSDVCDDRTMYCPAGTNSVNWCPAGSYCTQPNHIESCYSTQFCPQGTFAPQLCPAGKYCPTPSHAEECPSGSYCPKGSVQPTSCNFLTVCPAGSSSESRSFLAPFVLILVIAGVLAGFTFYTRWQRKQKVEVEEAAPVSPATRAFIDHAGDDEGYEEVALNGTEGATAVNIPTSMFQTPTITFESMGLTLKVGEAKGKKVLDDVSGTIPPGSFVAVMGPSGSGKSTFMHTLAGKAFYGDRCGRVLVNGDEVELTSFSKVLGFVKQDDIMLREMTVAETLLLNSRVRYDKRSIDSPEQIANAMLKALDLNHVRDTNIGDEKKRGISGGQRKRVNIGMEMVALPCVLFLDEPTSGLDSSSSMTVCSALRNMAEIGGVTIIAVIHQPRYEIFQMFHKVLLLAKGGKNVYYGDPTDALPYFENVLGAKCPQHANPPDFFMDVISGESSTCSLPIDVMQQKWGESDQAKKSIQEEKPELHSVSGKQLAEVAASKGMASLLTQTRLFTQRSFVQLSRDLVWFFTDLALVLIAGFFLGLVFSKSQYMPPLPEQIVNKSLSSFEGAPPSSLKEFFDRPVNDPIISEASLTCMAIGMTGVTAALRVFGNEQLVFWREASAGMSTTAYFVAKNITHILFIVLSPLLYLAPFLTFVSARATIMEYYKVVIVVQFTTTGLGYLISTLVPPGLAQLAGVVAVLVFSMFGGSRPTLPQIDQMFPLLRIMPYISYVRWGQEALYLTEIEKWKQVSGVDIEPSLKLFGYHLDNYQHCMAVCFCFGIFFRVVALLAMKFMNKDQKH